MKPRTKREKAAAERRELAARYGTLRVVHLYAAFGAGFVLASIVAALVVAILGAS